MKLTFRKLDGSKTTRQIQFIDIKADSVNREKDLFYFMDQKDQRFKSCKLSRIIKKETDNPILQMIKL